MVRFWLCSQLKLSCLPEPIEPSPERRMSGKRLRTLKTGWAKSRDCQYLERVARRWGRSSETRPSSPLLSKGAKGFHCRGIAQWKGCFAQTMLQATQWPTVKHGLSRRCLGILSTNFSRLRTFMLTIQTHTAAFEHGCHVATHCIEQRSTLNATTQGKARPCRRLTSRQLNGEE